MPDCISVRTKNHPYHLSETRTGIIHLMGIKVFRDDKYSAGDPTRLGDGWRFVATGPVVEGVQEGWLTRPEFSIQFSDARASKTFKTTVSFPAVCSIDMYEVHSQPAREKDIAKMDAHLWTKDAKGGIRKVRNLMMWEEMREEAEKVQYSLDSFCEETFKLLHPGPVFGKVAYNKKLKAAFLAKTDRRMVKTSKRHNEDRMVAILMSEVLEDQDYIWRGIKRRNGEPAKAKARPQA